MQTPFRPTLDAERSEYAEYGHSNIRTNDARSCGRRPCGYSPDQERRISQREKQVSYGYATEGYRNMIKLVQHDPLLKCGGILPLSPPDLNKGSKRSWDVSLRKWRRALHMFDCVYIDGEDEGIKTLDGVVEEQRLQWVSPTFLNESKEKRLQLSEEKIRNARNSSYVPTKLPVEESLKIILRSEDCYEPVSNVVPPSASSLIKGNDISPLDAGIKIYVAPSAHNQLVSTPDKPEGPSQSETPQRLDYSISTPAQVGKSPSAAQILSMSCSGFQAHPGESIPRCAVSPFLQHDPTSGTPFTCSHRPLRSTTGMNLQPISQEWDCIFAPPSCVGLPTHVSPASSGLAKMRTPATAPRRVTLLQGSGKEKKLGGGESLQRSLFPNSTTPCFHRGSGMKMDNPGTSSGRRGVSHASVIEHGKIEHPVVDSVSQQLFAEK